MEQQHQFVAPKTTAEFKHLFPPSGQRTPAFDQTPPIVLKPAVSQQGLDTVSPSIVKATAGVDYVIVFKFPTQVQKGDEKTSRTELQSYIAASLQSVTARLERVHLRYQVRPGKKEGTLLILVSSPVGPIKKQYKQERVRDFLLGVRVDEIEDNQKDDMDQAFQNLTEAERLRIVYEILTSPESEGGAGISSQVDTYVESIMPLHNDAFNKNWLKTWSTKWLINDHDLLQIRNQFGEKLAYYFAFVQTYFLWLSAPAGVGALVYLTHSNTLAVWFSLFMLIWSISFTEMWKRKEQEFAVQWGVRNYSKHEKRRLEFKGEKIIKDHVTGEDTPYVSAWKLFTRRLSSVPGVALGAILLSFIVGFVFVLQLFLHEYYNGPFKQYFHYAPTVGYVLLIPTMTGFYSKWVKLLTDWELHKTDASWEYSYTQKIFIANFLVGYLSLFITAWIYIPFGDHVLPYLSHYNVSHEHKTVDFMRLRAQLVYFIITGQIIGFLTEMVVPYVLKQVRPKVEQVIKKDKDINTDYKKERSTEIGEEAKFMEKVYREVDMEEYNIYTDYVEMVIQFGYVCMFSTVWPLTALCSMINNLVEIRADAAKVCSYYRRPVPHRAESIGPWLGNMETLVWLSSITMGSFAYLFHPSTDIHSVYTPVATLLAILLSEHLYVAVRFAIRAGLSMVPSSSDWLIRKEEYKLKRVWLDRMMVNHTQLNTRQEIGTSDHSDLSDTLSQQLWSTHLNSQQEAAEALQLVQNAFKTK